MIKKFFAVLITLVISLSLFSSCVKTNDDKKPTDDTLNLSSFFYSPNLDEKMAKISLTTDNGQNPPSDQSYVYGKVSVSDCKSEYELTNVTAQIKIRGNFTAELEKKPYRIKFDQKQKMLGLNNDAQCRNWVLIASYKDSSLMRDAVSYFIAQNLMRKDGYYVTDFRLVELDFNDEYQGVYLLAEQQQVNENRINVKEPAMDYTGTDIGYLIEYDGYYYNEPSSEKFTLPAYSLKDLNDKTIGYTQKGYVIKNNYYSQSQNTFIAKIIKNIQEIMYEAIYNDHFLTINTQGDLIDSPFDNAKQTIEAVVDVNSLANTYLLNEILVDNDIFWSSFFMSIDMSATGNKKLTFHAPWDFDSALGLIREKNDDFYAGNTQNNLGYPEYFYKNAGIPWLLISAKTDWFQSIVKQKWNNLINENILKGATLLLDTYAELYKDNFAKNFEKWPNSIGKKVENIITDKVLEFKSQKDASDYLKTWLNQRVENLDKLLINW